MKNILLLLFILVGSLQVSAQQERRLVRKGNETFLEAFKDKRNQDTVKYAKAETFYRKALEKDPENLQWKSNLASAILKQKHPKEAAEIFSEVAEGMTSNKDKAKAYYNLGNSYLETKELEKSIEAYKSSLRNDPTDLNTKYNLTYAIKKKQEQDQKKKEQDKKDQNKDQKNKDQNNKDQDKKDQNKKDQNKKDQDKKDQNKKDQNKKDQDKKDQNKKDQNKKDQDKKDQNKKDQNKKGQNKQKGGLDKERAKAMLKAMENKEKKTQQKVRQAQVKAAKAKARSIEKKW